MKKIQIALIIIIFVLSTNAFSQNNKLELVNVNFSDNILEEKDLFKIDLKLQNNTDVKFENLTIEISIQDNIVEEKDLAYISKNSEIETALEFIIPEIEDDLADLEVKIISENGDIIYEYSKELPVRHASEPTEEVHQYYAGEAGKLWPGWDGRTYTISFTVHKVKYHGYNVPDIPGIQDEDIYFKLYINDKFALLNDFGAYYHQEQDEWIYTEHSLEVTLPKYDILSIGFVGMDKIENFGTTGILDSLDEPLGKIAFIKRFYDNWGSTSNQTITSNVMQLNPNRNITIEYSINVVDNGEEELDPSNIDDLAMLEIKKKLGTKLILDCNYDNEEKFYSSYTGNYLQGLYLSADDSTYKAYSYLYDKTVPYSPYDNRYTLNIDKKFRLDNNDIIEGTHEEDVYNGVGINWDEPYSPDNVWHSNQNWNRDPIPDDDVTNWGWESWSFWQNHFWDSDIYNCDPTDPDYGYLNWGGYEGSIYPEPNASSSQLKAQLYWDYYVIPLYMQNNLNESYYFLGRVVHLLEDMSSIPHCHRDAHGPTIFAGYIDYFEKNVGKEYVQGNVEDEVPVELWNADNLKCIDFNNITEYIDGTIYEYTPTVNQNDFDYFNAKEEWDYIQGTDSDWPSNWNSISEEQWNIKTQLFKLFYSMCETTDNYPSRNYDGDFIEKDDDWEEDNWESAADDIMPKMMSHVAGLYRLFWASTHFPTSFTGNNEYAGYLEETNPNIAESMRDSYIEGFENENHHVYLGSPIDSCLVRGYPNGNSNYYRSYNHGGLFYNNILETCFYIGEGIWKKYKDEDYFTSLGMPISNEELDPNNNDFATVSFENGKIYWNDSDPTNQFAVVVLYSYEVVIQQPTSTYPINVGEHNNPSSFESRVRVFLDTGQDITDLVKDDFTVEIGGIQANVISSSYYDNGSSDGYYTLNIMPPQQSNNGSYDYTVKVDKYGIQEIDTETDAINYQGPFNNIDVALVLDRSGSMSGNKISQAKNAASQFAGLLNVGDEVAICSYASGASSQFDITEITGQQTIFDVLSAISTISSGGMTSIGAGMEEGRDQLANVSVENYPQGMLLLSDGRENTSPMVADILPTIPTETDIYTIGFGSGCDEDLMENIATTTDGFYRFAYNDGSNINAIVNEIYYTLTGQQLIAWFWGLLSGGKEIVEHEVVLDSLCSQTTFNLMWENSASDLDFVLVDPNNITINPDSAAADSTINFQSYSTQEFYKINNPQYGNWTMRVIGDTIPNPPENYDVTVSGFSGIEMQIAFDQDEYITGQPIIVTAELTSEGNPITGADSVSAEVENPNYVTETILLYDDGAHNDVNANDGIYGNAYTNATIGGSYTFTVSASGTATVGGQFTRIASRSTFVSGPTIYQTTLDEGFNMVAVPGNPSPAHPDSIFGDDIDPFYMYTNNSNIWWWSEINSSYMLPDEIENGYGYWVKAWDNNTTVDANVAPVTMPVTINLSNSANYYHMQHGYHMLGNPYNSSIDFGPDNFSLDSLIVQNIYVWSSINNCYELYPFDGSYTLDPWQAFWIQTSQNDRNLTMNLSNKEELMSQNNNKKDDITNWSIQFEVEVEGLMDVSNYAGIHENASNTWDVMDAIEIPNPNSDFVSFYFPHDDWGQYSADYTKDIRNPELNNSDWDIIVKSTESGEASITWDIPAEVPQDYKLKLIDHSNNTEINLRNESEYVFNAAAYDEYEFTFKIVPFAVDPGSELPNSFDISANYPNPFTQNTEISYQLPQEAEVEISIYNIKGQKINELTNERQEPGYYNTSWNGLNEKGKEVSSGIYFYIINAKGAKERYRESNKMIHLK